MLLPILLSCAAQMSIGTTTGTLPPATPTESLILGDDLADFRVAWLAPHNSYQQTWRDSAQSRAAQTPSGQRPTDFGVAASDASIAQAAALAWAMADDPGDLQKAVDTLLLANVPDSGTSITRPEVMTSYLLAYDFIRGADFVELPQSTRDSIEATLLSEAWSLDTGLTDSNAKGKIGATRALAGLLLMEQALLDRGLRDLDAHFRYSTTDDGWFTDSQGHYLNYTLSHIGPFVRAYQQGSGVDLYPNFAPYVEMSIGLRMPNGAVPNVSNGLNTPVGINEFSQSSDSALAAESLWNIFDGKPWSPCWSGTNLFNNDWSYTRFFAMTDCFDVVASPPSGSPTFLSRGQSGVSVFRQNWSPSSDYLLLSPGIDSPSGFLGIPAFHSHNDTAEILLCANGEYLLVASGYNRTDLGNSPPGFAPQNANWHNVLLVDGDVGSNNQGRKVRPGGITHTDRLDAVEDGGFQGACDLSMLEVKYRQVVVQRRIAFPEEDYFLIADRMAPENAATHNYGFNLVGRGTRTNLIDDTETVSNRWEHGVGRATATTFATGPLSSSTASIDMHDRFNVFEATERATANQSGQNAAAFLSVLEPGVAGTTEELSVSEVPASPGKLAATIDNVAEGWIDHVLLQGQAEVAAAGALASDAVLSWLRESASVVTGGAIAAGRTLAKDGVLLAESTAPLTISLRFLGAETRATISADAFTAGTELRLYGIGDITSALLDGVPLAFTNGATFSSIVLQGVSSAQPNLLEVQHGSPSGCGYFPYGYGLAAANSLRLYGEGAPAPGASVDLIAEGIATSTAWLVVSEAQATTPLLGGMLLVDSNRVLLQTSAATANGVASFSLSLPNDPGLIGRSFFLQSAAQDPAQSAGWALSQGLEVRVCS